jgi:ATPase family associated with various cellular activities (AAA)
MFKRKYSLDNIVEAGGWGAYTTGSALYSPKIVQALLSSDGDKVLQNISVSGVLIKSLDTLFSYIKSLGGKQIVHKTNGDHTFIWEDSYIDVDFNKKSNAISISGYILDPKLLAMVPVLEKDYVSKIKKNLVFTIIKTNSGFDITNMGDGSSPLITDNYLPEVLEEVDFVIKAFSKTPPAGRIAILNGTPGTGKTHLIRSILMQLDCVFLIIPSNMISSLDKPEFVPLLMKIKNEHEKPIIMIIEDGDICLVPREGDNISTITALLNLSDGIMGAIIDIKMIISTNADIKDMDQAIMRPGRLCRNIHVGPLPYEQANRVYRRLMKDESAKLEYSNFYTLAEIYDVFNNIDLVSATSSGQKGNRQAIGFARSSSNQSRVMNKSKKIGF